MGDIDLPDATTLGEFNIHMRVLRGEIHKLVVAMPQMATKADIAELSRKFEGYATHEDVRALRTDFEQLRERVEDGSVRSSISRWGDLAKSVMAIITLVLASAYCIVSLVEKISPPTDKVAK